MKPFAAAARILSGRTVIVRSIGVMADRQALVVASASKMASLSSCISLL